MSAVLFDPYAPILSHHHVLADFMSVMRQFLNLPKCMCISITNYVFTCNIVLLLVSFQKTKKTLIEALEAKALTLTIQITV